MATTYVDGQRFIIVLEKNENDLKNKILEVIGPVNQKQVPDLIAAQSIKEDVKQVEVPEINEDTLIREKGYEGFCIVYNHYMTYIKNLTPERKKQLKNWIDNYAKVLKNINVEMVNENDLIAYISIGNKYGLFQNTIKKCLTQSGYATLEDFLASGRRNLEDMFLACIGA